MSAMVYKISVVLAAAMNVSAYTTGNFKLSTVRIVMRQWLNTPNNTTPQAFFDQTFASGHSNLTTTGTQIFSINEEFITSYKLMVGVPITIQIIITCTTGTGTRQEGIMPLFPFQVTNASTSKAFTPSVIKFHVHPTLDHAYPVFRDQDAVNLVEYSPAFPISGAEVLPQIRESPTSQIHGQSGHLVLSTNRKTNKPPGAFDK